MNDLQVLLSCSSYMLSLEVNGGRPETEAEVLVSDNEPGLTNAVKAERQQLCILHAIKYLLFTLWKEGMSREDRDEDPRAIK